MSDVTLARACVFLRCKFAFSADFSRASRAFFGFLPGLLLGFLPVGFSGLLSIVAVLTERRQSVQLTLETRDDVEYPARTVRCRSSEVEHSLGKGEVESSILSGSTILAHPN